MSAMAARGETTEGLEVRAWRPEEPAELAAFAHSLAGRAPRFRPRTEAQWDWAFRRNPAGTRLFLARRAGRVVAAFGALPVRVRSFGEPRTFDALLDAGLASGEPEASWLACAEAFAAAHGGPQDDMLHFGWPEGRERELWKQALGHELVQVSALHVAGLGAGRLRTGLLRTGKGALPAGVEEVERFGPAADALYAACAPQWGSSAVRDGAFLDWRFAENPFHRYRLLVARGADGLRGLAVLRSASELDPGLHPGLGLLMELLVRPGDEPAALGLVEGAVALARGAGDTALGAALPEWSPWSAWLQARGFLHHPSEHLLHARGSIPRFDMLYLREHWWTTLADALLL
jgi:hypothetical protein